MAGIYVHVPFCKQKCSYCDFASFPREIGKAEAYFACLYKELKARSLSLQDKKFDTVYFGGGTPSFVEPKYIYGALKQIFTCFKVSKDAEITLEVNPGTIDENKLKVYKNAGINRFSVGLQTANDNTLYKINRIHSVQDFKNAIELLKDYNVSVDVMMGLPDETEKDVLNTLDLATSYPQVKHISVYALKAEEGTPMFTRYLNGELPSDDEVADIYDKVVGYLDKKGFNRYEVSNFAKLGYESRHNKNYWARGEY
ncbi:MAG: radical SAM family heme chaperone HemW, partial [Clostridia bacterium]|nr:radical SAM family heme chaperone HemW [Clostridia bacterium]